MLTFGPRRRAPACDRRNQFNDDPANRPVDRVDPLRSPRPISNVLPNQDDTGCRRSRLPRPDQRPVDSPLTKSLTQPVATICCRRRTRSTTTSGRSLSANRLDQRAVNHPSTLESHRAGHRWSMRSWDSVRPGFRRRRGVPRSHGPSGMRFAALKVNNWLTPRHRTPDSVLPQPWGSSRGQAGPGRTVGIRVGDDGRPACDCRNQISDGPVSRPVDQAGPARSSHPIAGVLPKQGDIGCPRGSLRRLGRRPVDHSSTLQSQRPGHRRSMRSWDCVRPGFRRRRGFPWSHGPSGTKVAVPKVNNWLTPRRRLPDQVLPQPWGSSRGQAGGRYAQGPLLAVGVREVGRNLGRRAGNDGRPARRLRAELGAVS